MNLSHNQVTIYIDGSCHGNPWAWWCAYVAVCDTYCMIGWGSLWFATNNQMELLGLICALRDISHSCTIITDSRYILTGIQNFDTRKKAGMKTKSKSPVKNAGLWILIHQLIDQHITSWYRISRQWTKWHSHDHYNIICDRYANWYASGQSCDLTDFLLFHQVVL